MDGVPPLGQVGLQSRAPSQLGSDPSLNLNLDLTAPQIVLSAGSGGAAQVAAPFFGKVFFPLHFVSATPSREKLGLEHESLHVVNFLLFLTQLATTPTETLI